MPLGQHSKWVLWATKEEEVAEVVLSVSYSSLRETRARWMSLVSREWLSAERVLKVLSHRTLHSRLLMQRFAAVAEAPVEAPGGALPSCCEFLEAKFFGAASMLCLLSLPPGSKHRPAKGAVEA